MKHEIQPQRSSEEQIDKSIHPHFTSEQPPATDDKQEWTPFGDAVKTAAGLFIDYASSDRAAKSICDAHNAALAAEREKQQFSSDFQHDPS